MEESGLGPMDPGGEEASEVGGQGVDGFSVVVGKNVDLGEWRELVVGLVAVLVAFDVEDVGLNRECFKEGADSL
jgi:hypothetical protein